MPFFVVRRLSPLLLLGMAFYLLPPRNEAAGTSLQYNRDIRPILSDHCFNCHGADEKSRKAGLRLDLRDAALKGGKSGNPAITPGKPEESELLKRITTPDHDDLMPPPDAKNPLGAAAIEKLRNWIAQGANYQGHWAFLAPVRPEIPSQSSLDLPGGKNFRIRNAIDALVLARLKEENLKPSPEAAAEILCRRLHLDITGLPPSIKEVESFVAKYNARGDEAYDQLVKELLNSPHYAERWARWWLDAARYADTDGYEKDVPRQQWTWRDWVLRSLQGDMPYNQFILEQIAGDLLPDASQDQRVATGFLRNGMVNEEGAIIAEQFRMEGMFDRMDTVGKSVLGLSIQCGQCHTHKFDPLTHEEYYRMFACLNDTYDATMRVYTPAQQNKIRRIKSGVDAEENGIKKKFPDWEERLEKWVAETAAKKVAWTPIDAIEQEWIGGLAHPQKIFNKSILTLGFRPTTGELFVTAITHETNITGIRLEALTHGDLPYRGPGRSDKGSFAVSEFYLEAAPVSVIGANTNHAAEIKSGLANIAITNAVADIELPDQQIDSRFRNGNDDKRRMGPAKFLIDGKDETAWSADLGPIRRHTDSQVLMQLGTNGWAVSEGTFLKFWLKFRHGGADPHGRDNNFLGNFRISLTTAENPLVDTTPTAIQEIIQKPKSARTKEENNTLFSYWRTQVEDFKKSNERIESLWKQIPEGSSVLNLAQREPEFHRDTYLLDRGDWQKPSRKVAPGVPAFLHSMPEGVPADRLSFAKWLVDPRSPTTARVAVNRVWQNIFGMGLVETAEDFGVRAPLPAYPEILDWLAVEFMEPGGSGGHPWSLKRLIHTIVSSSTYRQSSRVTPELIERDPRNFLLARAPRFRTDAEVVRDIALQAGGLLHDQMGGPSFYPPVPESLFALNYLKIDWKAAPVPERYRRSIYVFRRRSMPDPVMASFDAPTGDLSCVRRPRSNTPLAALASLNEPVFFEAARALALRTLKEGGSSDRERAVYAFRVCTSRAPSGEEIETTLDLLKSRKARLAEGWLPAKELAFSDPNAVATLPAGVTPADAAAWTVVSRVLLNLDETLSRN